MKALIPVHQFEIRYTQILNFESLSKELVAPFVKLASSINIENENTHRQKITLKFDEDGYTISVWWDRIFLRSESGYDKLRAELSPFESPFLNLFKKLTESSSFGQIANVIFYTIAVKIYKDIEIPKLVSDFKSTYFTEKIDELVSSSDDVSITLEKTIGVSRVSTVFGPYVGINDLYKRNITHDTITDPDTYIGIGRMAVITISRAVNDISLKSYKELALMTDKLIENL